MSIPAKTIVTVDPFKADVKVSDMKVVEETLPALKKGEVLIEAIEISVDPYIKLYMEGYNGGSVVVGRQTAKVIDTKHDDFPKGAIVYADVGWRTRTIVDPTKLAKHEFYLLPDFGGLPTSLALGVLGIPGLTAYFGFLEICKPKKGETVVVSGGAGAVGTVVGQIAKARGCRVIGFTGSDDKCKWLENEMGFDKAINYKKGDLAALLKEAAPNGVDCYFDNVAGDLSTMIISQMNMLGRVSICGAIALYNRKPTMEYPHMYILYHQLSIEAFHVFRWTERWFEGIAELKNLVKDGHIKYPETVTSGFENTPKAFIDMLDGKNSGKALVKV